jgi:hypothetical protein
VHDALTATTATNLHPGPLSVRNYYYRPEGFHAQRCYARKPPKANDLVEYILGHEAYERGLGDETVPLTSTDDVPTPPPDADTPLPDEDMLTISQAARLLGLTKQEFRALGISPDTRIPDSRGARVRYWERATLESAVTDATTGEDDNGCQATWNT